MSSRSAAELKAVVFDLDDTLAPSKSTMDPSMSEALARLLDRIDVCIISGGKFEQFVAQALGSFHADDAAMSRLHLMPTCGTRYYLWREGEWQLQYAEDLTADERSRTIAALEAGARELGMWHPGAWGDIIEDRGSQITFSALGQRAPIAEKTAWDPDGAKKRELGARVQERLPDLEVRGGGSTSLDITRKGIDKAYGIDKLVAQLGVTIEELLFIGDRLDEAGNDYPVYERGVLCVPVHDWTQTRDYVDALLPWLDSADLPFPLPAMPRA
jgi:phosphomannomutase